MDSIKPKGGLSGTFFGAIFGVVTLVFIQIISAAIGGRDVAIIPTLDLSGNPLEFIGKLLAYFFTTAAGLMFLIVTIICYIAATVFVQKSTTPPTGGDKQEHDTSSAMRGWLIGLTSGMNFILARNIYGMWFGETVGLVIAIVLFVMGFIACFKVVSQAGAYQSIIGWICWLAPMSWIVLLLGLILVVLNLIGGLIGLAGVEVFKLSGDKNDSSVDSSVKGKFVSADWGTGTFFFVGGIVANLNPHKTAFNMGNIGFVHRKADHDHRKHEAGHNLNLFVYGWIVHLIGAVDENVVGYRERAITELMAESHDIGTTRPTLEVWA